MKIWTRKVLTTKKPHHTVSVPNQRLLWAEVWQKRQLIIWLCCFSSCFSAHVSFKLFIHSNGRILKAHFQKEVCIIIAIKCMTETSKRSSPKFPQKPAEKPGTLHLSKAVVFSTRTFLFSGSSGDHGHQKAGKKPLQKQRLRHGDDTLKPSSTCGACLSRENRVQVWTGALRFLHCKGAGWLLLTALSSAPASKDSQHHFQVP